MRTNSPFLFILIVAAISVEYGSSMSLGMSLGTDNHSDHDASVHGDHEAAVHAGHTNVEHVGHDASIHDEHDDDIDLDDHANHDASVHGDHEAAVHAGHTNVEHVGHDASIHDDHDDDIDLDDHANHDASVHGDHEAAVHAGHTDVVHVGHEASIHDEHGENDDVIKGSLRADRETYVGKEIKAPHATHHKHSKSRAYVNVDAAGDGVAVFSEDHSKYYRYDLEVGGFEEVDVSEYYTVFCIYSYD